MPLSEKDFRRAEDAAALVRGIRSLTGPERPLRVMEICGTHTMAYIYWPAPQPAGAGGAAGVRAGVPGVRDACRRHRCGACAERTAGVVVARLRRPFAGAGQRAGGYPSAPPGAGRRRDDCLLPAGGGGGRGKGPGPAVCVFGRGVRDHRPRHRRLPAGGRRAGACQLFGLVPVKADRTRPAGADRPRRILRWTVFCARGTWRPSPGRRRSGFCRRSTACPRWVSGFEAGDILYSVWRLAKMRAEGRPGLENEYTRLVRGGGNPAAQAAIDRVFVPAASLWRGLGEIPESGYAIRPEFAPGTPPKSLPSGPAPPPTCPAAAAAR